ncbi:helix-turn-helix domain-containing protein [Streptomyces sp. SCSIO ZS0520]|uniref:helix-turn-helix domain-containing protein n=1 Tax=Streptomyces sp. SCSIO ZS0520 TaxID=2892996 RepID=UPI0021DA556B|nr:helix-turn-helix transcriptional regulator [Streptomyces sp. SCSIO ZS0520]
MFGRVLKMWRESANMSVSEFAAAMGYGENQIYKMESGTRIPRPEALDKADEVLDAGGKIVMWKPEMAEARYPKKVRDLAKLEAKALEVGAYGDRVVHALLQTSDYLTALYRMRRPVLANETIEREVAARKARQAILGAHPAPVFSFVQEEVTLRRPIGGPAVWRGQLERLLELSQLRNVEIQVMPTNRIEHVGLDGAFRVLKLRGGKTLGHVEVQGYRQLISDPAQVQPLEMRYGIIRAQALPQQESLAFIEDLLGEK